MQLGSVDIEILQALRRGQKPDVRSAHRIRLEMMGLAKDGPLGLLLTTAGELAAAETERASSAAPAPEQLDEATQRYDVLGRRLGRRLTSLN